MPDSTNPPVVNTLLGTPDGRRVLATLMVEPIRCPGNWVSCPQDEKDPVKFQALVDGMSGLNCATELDRPLAEVAPWQAAILEVRAAEWRAKKKAQFQDKIQALTDTQLHILCENVASDEVRQFAQTLLSERCALSPAASR